MPSAQPSAAPLSFGKRYAVLNLDFMNILFDIVKDTPEGSKFVANCSRWVDAVHKRDPRPLTVFTTLYFTSPSQAELPSDAPFTKLVNGFGTFDEKNTEVQVPSYLNIDDKDIVLQKTRCYAGAGNALETILKENNVDTVVISGLSLSGVVMSTVYRLFDLDYNVYVISDNVLELPVSHHEKFAAVLLDSWLPKMNLKAITFEEAIEALEHS
ncbi:Isochorismatase-like protein [Trichoderma longibrachiatum]